MEPTNDIGLLGLADYLAKALIAKKGFRSGVVPEAQSLLAHCDAVLTRANGVTMEIVGIVDVEAGTRKEFGLTKEALEKMGKGCLRYTAKAGFRKLPVSVSIMEVGRNANSPEAINRLSSLKSRSLFSKVLISAWALDVANRALRTNAPFGGRFGLWPFIHGLMTRPAMSADALIPKAHAAMADHRPLYLTYGLLALIAAVFFGEYIFRIGQESGVLDPGIPTLVALGALDANLVMRGGEWWRLFTAPLLHGGPIHILFNGVALFLAGAVLERVIGRIWFAAIFVVAGICGALLSLALNPPTLISVGASGAIMGLFAAAFAVSYRYPTASPMRTYLLSGSLRVLIPSMIPLADGLFGERIDFAAHLGGAVGGVALGITLTRVWSADSPLPPYRWLARLLTVVGICGVIYGVSQISSNYEQYTLESYLIPSDRLLGDTDEAEKRSEELVRTYPHDPRSHMYRARLLARSGDESGAEREWRLALGADKMLRTFFKPELERYVRASLALTLEENGKNGDAKEIAKPLCSTVGDLRDAVAKAGLCH